MKQDSCKCDYLGSACQDILQHIVYCRSYLNPSWLMHHNIVIAAVNNALLHISTRAYWNTHIGMPGTKESEQCGSAAMHVIARLAAD